MPCAEQFNFFSLYQSDVLTRVNVLSEVPITCNSHPALDRDMLTLYLRRVALRTDKDSLNVHRLPLPYNVGIHRRRRRRCGMTSYVSARRVTAEAASCQHLACPDKFP